MDKKLLIRKIKKSLNPEIVEELLYDLGSEEVVHTRGNELNYNCLNPDHLDTNPSANYNLKKNLFNCLSCGVGGDVFKLVMVARDMNFNDSITFLANKLNIINVDTNDELELNLENRQRLLKKEIESTLFVEEEVSLPFYYSLEWDKASIRFLEYLKNRKLDVEVLIKYGIGYCDRGYWRNRLIIPFFQWDKIAGFTARSIYNKKEYLKIHLDEEYYAKYKHKASTDIDHIIYGLDIDYNEKDPIFVEGSLDCIRLRSYGLNAYSTLSNKVSTHQAKIIKKIFSGDLYLMPDNDAGGRIMIEKFVEYLGNSFKIKMVDYSADDPDGLSREEAIKSIENAQSLFDVEENTIEPEIIEEIFRDHNSLLA